MAEQQPRPILITGQAAASASLWHTIFCNSANRSSSAIVRPIRRLTACAKRARSACRPILAAMTAF